jgi:hypothetical protein
MNVLLAFLCGFATAVMIWLALPPADAPVVYVPKVERIVVQEEVMVEKDCPAPEPQAERQCIEPSYVLGLMKDCRAGRLDQTDPDVTVRR